MAQYVRSQATVFRSLSSFPDEAWFRRALPHPSAASQVKDFESIPIKLEAGQRVTFEVTTSEKGTRATHVRLAPK